VSLLADPVVAFADPAHKAQQQRHRQFGGGAGELVRQVRDPHSSPCARGDVDVVVALQGGADDPQVRCGGQERLVHMVGHADDHTHGLLQLREHLRAA
jgi:hypothetical protein